MREKFHKIYRQFPGLRGLSTPIVAVWCSQHKRWEWADRFSERGGVAPDLETLKRSLRQLYRCSQCGSWHVSFIIINGKLESFYSFINS